MKLTFKSERIVTTARNRAVRAVSVVGSHDCEACWLVSWVRVEFVVEDDCSDEVEGSNGDTETSSGWDRLV